MFKILFATAMCIFISGCLAVPSGPDLSSSQLPTPSTSASLAAGSGGDSSVAQHSDRPDDVMSVVSHPSVEKSCKSGSAAIDGDRYADCVKQEMDAKRQIAQSKSYSSADRQACASGDSYVEQLTCLQMKDWLKHPEDSGDGKKTAAAKANQALTGTAKSPSASGATQP